MNREEPRSGDRAKREDTKKAAEVMLAFVAGEEIEAAFHSNIVWREAPNPLWDWNTYDYRVKPKAPPTYFTVDYSLENRRKAAYVGMLYDTREEAEAVRQRSDVGRVIELQEVVR